MIESIPWMKKKAENVRRTQSLISHLMETMRGENFKLLEVHENYAFMLVSLDGACCMLTIREDEVLANYKFENARTLEYLLQNIETWEGETRVVSEIRFR